MAGREVTILLVKTEKGKEIVISGYRGSDMNNFTLEKLATMFP
jgi:hypothetical protein